MTNKLSDALTLRVSVEAFSLSICWRLTKIVWKSGMTSS
jgi:hypothetical protein